MDDDPANSYPSHYLLIGGIAAVVIVAVFLYGVIFWELYSSGNNGTNDSKKLTLSSVSFEEPVLARGQNLYERYCVTCHGRNGRGQGPAAAVLNPKPTNFHSKEAQKFSADYMFKIISKGKKERGMPAWEGRLTKHERWAIVSYIQKKWTRPKKSPHGQDD